MECACDVDVDLGDRVVLLSIVTPIARIQHVCNECRHVIEKGAWYVNERFIYEGVFSTHKTCEHCWSLRQVFFSSGWYYGMLWEQMWDTIRAWDGDISVSCIKDLTPVARGNVCDMMDEYWENENERP